MGLRTVQSCHDEYQLVELEPHRDGDEMEMTSITSAATAPHAKKKKGTKQHNFYFFFPNLSSSYIS